MKKLLPLSLILSFLMVAPVLAQDSSNPGILKRPPELRDTTLKPFLQIKPLELRDASRSAALQAKLKAFKDQQKATIAGRISDNLNKLNQNRTQALSTQLQKMAQILAKIQTRSGVSTSSATQAAVQDAQTAIATANTAVTAQAAKTYEVKVTSEQTVKADVKATRDQLHSDLEATTKLVLDARKATVTAINLLVSNQREGEASGSAK